MIKIRTSLDNYSSRHFPKLTTVPRIGESVCVHSDFIHDFEKRRLPIKLKVIDITHSEHGIVCEVWYKDIDVKIAKQNRKNLF